MPVMRILRLNDSSMISNKTTGQLAKNGVAVNAGQ
jgi:hypothetical protein